MPLTPTSRLALVRIDPNATTGDFVDATVLNANSDKVDAAIGAFPCTAATRPAAPFHGQFIRETDTRRVYVWNTTQNAWDLVAGRMGTSVRRAAAQTLNSAAVTPVSWDTEVADTDALWTPGANAHIITIPTTGMWVITVVVTMAAAASARTFVEIVLGSLPGGPYYRASIGRDGEDTGMVSATLPLSAAETITVNAYRSAAAGTTMTGRLDCYRVGA